jgi:predicted DCC family thiol-disulfide oxidoreductase YuxK
LIYVVFDGDCGICSESADFIEKNKNSGILKTVPSYEFDLGKYNIDSKLAELTVIFINDKSGEIFYRTRAVLEILKHLRGVYKFIGYIFGNPLTAFLFDPIYNIIAKNRAKISAKFGFKSCRVKF